MAVAARVQFDPAVHARLFVKLLDEGPPARLLEVVAVRGMSGAQPSGNAAVKLLPVDADLPDDPFEAVDRAVWVPIEEATALVVVTSAGDDSG